MIEFVLCTGHLLTRGQPQQILSQVALAAPVVQVPNRHGMARG